MQKFTHFGVLAQVLKDKCSHQHSSIESFMDNHVMHIALYNFMLVRVCLA